MIKFYILLFLSIVLGIGLVVFVFSKAFKGMFRLFKNIQNQEIDSPEKFEETAKTTSLSKEIDQIVADLEKERVSVKAKTKGLFKRAFLRSWITLSGIAVILIVSLSDEKIAPAIAAIVMCAALSAMGAGLYTLFKKGSNRYDFVKKLKSELVSEIVKSINPELIYKKEGISIELFKEAKLFNGSILESEDSIVGTIEGAPILFSECLNRSQYRANSDRSSGFTFFDGIFVKMKLEKLQVSSPIKIIPSFAISNNDILRHENVRKNRINIDEASRIEIDASLENGDYGIFCEDQTVASQFISPKTIKVLNFIFEKYESEKASLFEGFPILGNFKRKSGVYISIVNDSLYLFIDWNKDMFEPDTFLNNNLVDTGIAQSIYQDLLFIHQVVKEIALLEKVSS